MLDRDAAAQALSCVPYCLIGNRLGMIEEPVAGRSNGTSLVDPLEDIQKRALDRLVVGRMQAKRPAMLREQT